MKDHALPFFLQFATERSLGHFGEIAEFFADTREHDAAQRDTDQGKYYAEYLAGPGGWGYVPITWKLELYSNHGNKNALKSYTMVEHSPSYSKILGFIFGPN